MRHLDIKKGLLALVVAFSMAAAARAQSVSNGGFETDPDFTGWNLQQFAGAGGGGGTCGNGGIDPANGCVEILGDFYSPAGVKGGEKIVPVTLGEQTFTKATIDFDVRNLQVSTGFNFPFMSFVVADLISTEPKAGGGYRLDYKYEFVFSYFITGHSMINGAQKGNQFNLGMFWICPFKGTNVFQPYKWDAGRAYHVTMDFDTTVSPQYTRIMYYPKDNPSDVKSVVATSNQWRVPKFRGPAYVLIFGVRELQDPIFNSRGAIYSNLKIEGTLATGDTGPCGHSVVTPSGDTESESWNADDEATSDAIDDHFRDTRLGDDVFPETFSLPDEDPSKILNISSLHTADVPTTGQFAVVTAATAPVVLNELGAPAFNQFFAGVKAAKLGDLIATLPDDTQIATNYRSFMTQKVQVPASDPILNFSYAVVAQPGGGINDAAGVRILVYDRSDPSNLDKRVIDLMDNAWSGRSGWFAGFVPGTGATTLHYRPWTRVRLEIDPTFAGRDLEVVLEVHDSTDGQRAALAYFDEVSVGSENPDNQAPFGYLEGPGNGTTLSGPVAPIYGWALDDNGVESVQLYLDGAYIGDLFYGFPRPDVAAAYPLYPNKDNAGFGMLLDTTRYGNGTHNLAVRAKDVLKKGTFLANYNVTFQN